MNISSPLSEVYSKAADEIERRGWVQAAKALAREQAKLKLPSNWPE